MSDARRAARRAEVERNDRALLAAARAVLAEDGAHASVATIAARAGVGIGTLYRRYRTKEELFQRHCTIALADYLRAAQDGLDEADPWEGLALFIRRAVLADTGALGAIAGTIAVTDEMAELSGRGDVAAREVIGRAHAAGVLRRDVSEVDVALLVEQLGRSPLVDTLAKQGREDLLEAARQARVRILTVALDGLRAPSPAPLPGAPPGWELFTERWGP